MGEKRLRREIVATARRMNRIGLNQGTSGNLSARLESGFLVTPSGLPYDSMTPDDVVLLSWDGAHEPHKRPSSEWRFHRDILANRPEAGAVLHVHAMFATVLACLGLGIPAFHYMVAVAGGADIRCAPYATFGSQELSDHAVRALEGRGACLLANHGLIVLGATPAAALDLAQEVETLAAQYWRARLIGEPNLLDAAEMDRVLAKFADYRAGRG